VIAKRYSGNFLLITQVKMGLKFFIFNTERYEVPISVTTFADGSGRIDIK
jgi:hypothetical protein